MLSAEEFANKLKNLRNHGNTETVGQIGSSLDTVELVAEDNSRGENLKCFSVDLDKYPSNMLTDEQVRDILAGMPFMALPESILNTFLTGNTFKLKCYTEFFRWIICFANEHLWDYCRIVIRSDGKMSEFLIFDDCKSISKVPITFSAGATLKIRYIDFKICAFESIK